MDPGTNSDFISKIKRSKLLRMLLEIFISLGFWPVTVFLAIVLFSVRFLVQKCLYMTYGNLYSLVTGADALLSYKCPGNSSVIHSVSIMKGRPNLDLMRTRYEDRVFTFTDGTSSPIYSKLKKIVTLKWGFYCWKDGAENFDISRHVRVVEGLAVDDVVNEEQLLIMLSKMMDESDLLKEDKPQWEHLIIPNFRYGNSNSSNHFACIYRVHHAYTDGVSIGTLTDAVLADEPLKFFVDPLKPFPGMNPAKNLLLHFRAFVRGPLAFLLTLKSAIYETSPFCVNPYSNKKFLNWTEPIEMELLKNIKNQTNCSLASILVTCISRGLKIVQEKRFPKSLISEKINIANMSVILPYKNRQLQNHFTTFSIPYPLKEDNIMKRLKESDKIGREMSNSSEPYFNFYVLRFSGCLPKIFQDWLLGLAGTPVLFSNIPGVAEPFSIFGGVVCDLGAWVPLLRVVGMTIATYSYNGKLRICITADSNIFSSQKELKSLLIDVQSEIKNLAKYCGIETK